MGRWTGEEGMEGKLYSGLELNSEPQRPGLVGGRGGLLL